MEPAQPNDTSYPPLSDFLTNSFNLVDLVDDDTNENGVGILKGETTMVRSKTYLTNKVKEYSKPNSMKIIGVDMMFGKVPLYNIAEHPNCPLAGFHKNPNAPNVILIPTASQAHLLIFFEVPSSPNDNMDASKFKQLQLFIKPNQGSTADDNTFRNSRFKMEPIIKKGAWVVRKMVGEVPCLLGNKLTTTYYSGERYFEIDVDVNSTASGARIFKMVKGYAKSLVVDLIFWLESKTDDELPEQIWSGVRFYHINLDNIEKRHQVYEAAPKQQIENETKSK